MAKKKVNSKAYNQMRNAIFGEEEAYQYFKGNAFIGTERASNAMRAGIREEVWEALGTSREDKVGSNVSAIGDLEFILQTKIQSYYRQEEKIYNRLLQEVEKIRQKTGSDKAEYSRYIAYDFYPVSTSITEQIKQWDSLLSMPLSVMFANNGSNIDFSSNQKAALYCFLQSKTMYEAIKNVKEVSSVLSRKFWLKGEDVERLSDYDTAIQQVEQEMIAGLIGDGKPPYEQFKQSVTDALVEAAGAGYASAIKSSFREWSKSQKNTLPTQFKNYQEFHDILKQWGESLLTYINSSNSKKLAGLKINRVDIKNNGVIFFTLRDDSGKENIRTAAKKTAKGATDAERARVAIYESIERFIDNMKSTGAPFTLDVLGAGKVTFTHGTAVAALQMFRNSNTVFRKAFDNMMKTYEKDGGAKSLDNNAVLTGILGEVAMYINPNLFGFNRKMMGAEQQRYNGISSGQYFSDMVIDNLKVTYDGKEYRVGLNIKNYMDGDDHFTLARGQKDGLTLDSAILRRYLSEEEIKLIKFVQANQKLINEFSGRFGGVQMNVQDAAQEIMNRNVVNIFRIQSAEQDVINYIVAANGHFIPASCIFKVALNKLKTQQDYKFYDILNTKPIAYKKQDDDDDYVDTSRLKIDTMSANRFVKYKLNEFTVSVSELI